MNTDVAGADVVIDVYDWHQQILDAFRYLQIVSNNRRHLSDLFFLCSQDHGNAGITQINIEQFKKTAFVNVQYISILRDRVVHLTFQLGTRIQLDDQASIDQILKLLAGFMTELEQISEDYKEYRKHAEDGHIERFRSVFPESSRTDAMRSLVIKDPKVLSKIYGDLHPFILEFHNQYLEIVSIYAELQECRERMPEIISSEMTFWQKYRTRIASVMAILFFALVLLIILLVISSNKTN